MKRVRNIIITYNSTSTVIVSKNNVLTVMNKSVNHSAICCTKDDDKIKRCRICTETKECSLDTSHVTDNLIDYEPVCANYRDVIVDHQA